MKKKTKKIFGLLGIIAVIGMTVFAISLPSPEANATDSITDTIQVRVVGSTPDVNFANIENKSTTVYPNKSFSVIYENIEDYSLTVIYTDKNGEKKTETLDDFFADYSPDKKDYVLVLTTEDGEKKIYNYGTYELNVEGFGYDTYDSDDTTFYYLPVVGEIIEDEDTGDYKVELEYADEDDGGEVEKIKIIIKDENGKEREIIIEAPKKEAELPLDEFETGKLTIEIYAYNDTDEEALYDPYILTIDYKSVNTPDTGSFTAKLNISKEDYLVTGLITFGIIAIAGMVFLRKTDKNSQRAHVQVKRASYSNARNTASRKIEKTTKTVRKAAAKNTKNIAKKSTKSRK